MRSEIDPAALRALVEKANLPCVIADTHNARVHAGKTFGILQLEGHLVPLGSVVIGVEGMPQDEGRARIQLLADAVNALPLLLDERAADKARIGVLEAALEPFAAEADHWIEMGDTRPIREDTDLTVQHLRAARSALGGEGAE